MFRSLRVRNYRLYASGQLVSLTGTWMQRVAQDWLVLNLTNSGTALGFVTALQFGPSLLLGLWGGVLADRLDKRKLLLGTQAALALIALTLGLLDVGGVVQYWHVLVLAAALGMVSAIDTPTRQSFVVEMVGRNDLTNAVGINSTIFNSARIIGPAVAGLMITAVGTGWAFVANAGSSVAVLAGLYLMRPGELYPAPPIERAKGQLLAGVRYVLGRSDLALTMVLVFVVGTFGMNFQITTALIAKQVFHRSATGYGLLSTALAVGACLGAVLATRRTRRPSSLFLVCAATAFGLIEVAAGSMPGFNSTAVLLVPAGLAMLTFTTAANASAQLGVEPTMRGRVMALYLMCFMGGTPVGAPIIGWVAGAFGPRWGMVGGGLLSAAAALGLGLLVARRRNLSLTDIAVRLRPGGRLPGVVLRGRAMAREDLVEPGERLLVQRDVQRPNGRVELLAGAGADDRGRDCGLVQ
jgi:MFS family permease